MNFRDVSQRCSSYPILAPEVFKATKRVCDQCFTKRKKCNQATPVCARCLKAGLTCTRERPRKYQTREKYENINSFNVVTNTLTKSQKKGSTRTQIPYEITKPIYLKKRNIYNDLQTGSNTNQNRSRSSVTPNSCTQLFRNLIIPSDWEKGILKWTSTTLNRFIFHAFVRVTGISITSATSSDMRFLAGFFNRKLEPFKVLKCKDLHLTHSFKEVEATIKLGTEAYFQYFNLFFPLFSLKSFHSKPRSRLLKLAVCRIGLQFLPRTALHNHVPELIDKELLIYSTLSRIPVSLNSFQALFCLAIGISGSPLDHLKNSFFILSSAMIYQLGLHTSCPHASDGRLCNERRLALRLVNFLDSYMCNLRGTQNLPSESLVSEHSVLCLKKKQVMNEATSYNSSTSQFSPGSFENKLIQPYDFEEQLFIVISSCTHRSALIIKDLTVDFTHCLNHQTPTDKVFKKFKAAEKTVRRIYAWGLKTLKEEGLYKSSPGSEVDVNSSQPPSLSNFILNKTTRISDQVASGNQLFSYLNFIIKLRASYDLLRIMELGTHFDTNQADYPISPWSLPHLESKFVEDGLYYAIQVINYISKINPEASYYYYQTRMLFVASRFIMQHFHQICRNYKTESADNKLFHRLLIALSLSRKVMVQLGSVEVHQYTANAHVKLLDALAARFYITIPTS